MDVIRAPISKHEFYRRYLQGDYSEFGNRLRTWFNGDEMWKSGYRGLCTVRGIQTNSGKSIKRYGVPAKEARFSKDPVNESPDDSRLVIQGEVSLSEYGQPGLYLAYSTVKNIPNQKAMRATNLDRIFGLRAVMVLRSHMDTTSYEHVMSLLQQMPEAQIEFGTYSYRLGVEGNFTVIWEVRNY